MITENIKQVTNCAPTVGADHSWALARH